MSVIGATVRSVLTGVVLWCAAITSALAQGYDLTLYVFDVGTPVQNVEIILDDDLVGLTNEYGVARLSVEPGIRFLELRVQDSVVLQQQILAVEHEIAQWIVDITGGGSAIYDVES